MRFSFLPQCRTAYGSLDRADLRSKFVEERKLQAEAFDPSMYQELLGCSSKVRSWYDDSFIRSSVRRSRALRRLDGGEKKQNFGDPARHTIVCHSPCLRMYNQCERSRDQIQPEPIRAKLHPCREAALAPTGTEACAYPRAFTSES